MFIVTIIEKKLTSQHRNLRSVRLNRVVGFFVFCFIVSFVRVLAIWCWVCLVRTNKNTFAFTLFGTFNAVGAFGSHNL